jgi:hypothetical protein
MSKNLPTIEHLRIACRHIDELMAAGVTENHAIRTLELFSDYYAKVHNGGSVVPHHVDEVQLWSMAARKLRTDNPLAKAQGHLIVEHGTPKRAFARKIRELYQKGDLNPQSLSKIVEQYWKLAVITVEENERLNKVARSKMYDTPELRWAAAGIVF